MFDLEAPHIDAARVRTAGKDLLSLALMDARNHTLRWIGALESALGPAGLDALPARDADMSVLPSPLWVLGRIGWFQERWIARNVQVQRGERCDPTQPKLASILSHADLWYERQDPPHALSASTPRPRSRRRAPGPPTLQATRQYLADTFDITLELLDGGAESDAALYFYRLALLNEDQQAETFAVIAQTLGIDTGLLPPAPTLAARAPLLFPATRWMLGSAATGGFVFDEERDAHEVAIPEFEIDAQAVNWAQFCEFVEDGGYDEPAFWSEPGWAWVQREGRRTPRHVDQMRQGVLRRRFGGLARAPQLQAAVHVSAHEADAWCRWAGRRLPGEAEWEAAAHQGATRGFRWGEVHEWTATTARPYPGFSAAPYREMPPVCFDGGHRVLRGASFATRDRLRHAKARLFRAPQRDELFCGFRSCAA